MVQLYKLLVLICLVSAANVVAADVGQEIKDGVNIELALREAVAGGMTIDQAISNAIALNPELSKAIVTAAFTLLNTLPASACEILDEDGKQLTPPEFDNQEACGNRIIQEALAANENLDPQEITAAAAAGVTGGPGGPGVMPGPGDGNRGGNIASPS